MGYNDGLGCVAEDEDDEYCECGGRNGIHFAGCPHLDPTPEDDQ